MLVSVIVPMYNSETTIIQTIKSILSQTYSVLEIIVINDGSTDGGEGLVKEIGDNRIRIINQINKGVSAARNTGVRNSKGEYIAFCDSDDCWLPCKLEKQMEVLLANPDIDFIGCNRNSEMIKVGLTKYDHLRKIQFNHMLLRMFPQTSTAVVKRTVFEVLGGYDESQRYAEDGNLWLRICAKYNCFMMPESLVVTGNGKPNFGFSGLSSNLSAMTKGVVKNLSDMHRLGYINSAEFLFHYLYNILKYFRRLCIVRGIHWRARR